MKPGSLAVVLASIVLAACGAPSPDASSAGATELVRSTGDDVVSAEVDSVLTALRATHYQHDSNIDARAGVFDTDCSGFVDYVLERARPGAYAEVQEATTDRAVAGSYVTFIAGLSDAQPQWKRILHAKYLVAGDVIAWLIPAGVVSDDTGHVMFVADAPVLSDDGATAIVPIVDSTDNGHGDADPRSPADPSGVGRGTMVLTLDDDGVPTGYRWSTDADSPAYATKVVMARVD